MEKKSESVGLLPEGNKKRHGQRCDRVYKQMLENVS